MTPILRCFCLTICQSLEFCRHIATPVSSGRPSTQLCATTTYRCALCGTRRSAPCYLTTPVDCSVSLIAIYAEQTCNSLLQANPIDNDRVCGEPQSASPMATS